MFRGMKGVGERGLVARLVSAVDLPHLLGILAVASVVLPVLLFGGFSYLNYRSHVQTAQSRLVQTLDVVHEHIRKVFETHDLATIHVQDLLNGRSREDLRANERSLHIRLSALKNAMPHIRDIRVIAEDGTPIVSASVFPFLPSPKLDYTGLPFFRVHKEGQGDRFISELTRSTMRSGLFFADTRAWRDENRTFRGVIIMTVDPSYFQSYLGGFDENHVFNLIREDGSVLVRHPGSLAPGMKLPDTAPLFNELARDPAKGKYRAFSSIDGVERLVSYRKLAEQPIYVTASYNMADVKTAWRKDMLSHLLLAGPATFGLFLISLLAYGQAVREQKATARLREEIDRRELTEARLVQSQKMEAVGRLTGGIAHDFNNLLTVILGNLETVRRQIKNPADRVRRALDNAQQGAERAASLTHRLLAFSRRQPLEVRPLDLNALVSGMSDLMRRTIGETITIEFKLAGSLHLVNADHNQVENALLNLVINARDAMPDGGRLVIETANVDIAQEAASSDTGPLPPGPYVLLSVADSGTGIPKDVLDMVFEPFFTTKPAGQGTGLGLSMVYGFMQQSGGHVQIESEVGHGTTVRLFFPRAAKTDLHTVAQSPRPDIPIEAVGNGEVILVCEDDEGVRSFSSQTLTDLGYKVVEAVDMDDALRKLADTPDIKLLFTDIVLPGEGNGRMLADEALRRRPGLKVLFTTGYTRDALLVEGHIEDGIELLTKPFSSAALAQRVHQLLAS